MKKLYIFLIIVIVAGCKKSDNQVPTITISSPLDNQSFTAGQKVHVLANVTDNSEIHMVHLRVEDLTTNQEIIHIEDHVDVASFNFDTSFIANAATNYKIEVEANNHSGNDAIKDINIKGL
ncbi:MAG: Ig-like domain-containing protein [Flavisolibacter sp.]|jgi:hypothetical protein